MMSTASKTRSKSSLTARRVFCAFSAYRATRADPLTNVPTSTRRAVSAPNAAPRNDAEDARNDASSLPSVAVPKSPRSPPNRTPSYRAKFELASADAMT